MDVFLYVYVLYSVNMYSLNQDLSIRGFTHNTRVLGVIFMLYLPVLMTLQYLNVAETTVIGGRKTYKS